MQSNTKSIKKLRGYVHSNKPVSWGLIREVKEFIHPTRWDLLGIRLGQGYQLHPHIEEAQRKLLEVYTQNSETLFILNCAGRKPYTKSVHWKAIKQVLDKYGNKVDVVFSSSTGPVPLKFCKYYPFAHYSVNIDDNVSLSEWQDPNALHNFVKVNLRRWDAFLTQFPYKYIVTYFRPSDELGNKLLFTELKKKHNFVHYDLPSRKVINYFYQNKHEFGLTWGLIYSMEAKGELNHVLQGLRKNELNNHGHLFRAPKEEEMKSLVRDVRQKVVEFDSNLRIAEVTLNLVNKDITLNYILAGWREKYDLSFKGSKKRIEELSFKKLYSLIYNIKNKKQCWLKLYLPSPQRFQKLYKDFNFGYLMIQFGRFEIFPVKPIV